MKLKRMKEARHEEENKFVHCAGGSRNLLVGGGNSSYCSVVAGKSLYNYIVITLITLGASLVALLALSPPGKIWGYTRRRVVGAMRAVTPRCLDHPVCVQMVLKVVVRCRTPGIGYGPRPLIVTTKKKKILLLGGLNSCHTYYFFLSDPFNYYSGSEPSLMIFCVALLIVPLKTLSEGFHAICNDDERFVRDNKTSMKES
jgi:hypothetical protein